MMIKYFSFIAILCAYENAFSMAVFTPDDMVLTKNHLGVQYLLRQHAEGIIIPSERRDDKRTSLNSVIFDNEYRGLSNLKYLGIPDEVSILGESAFQDCDLRVVSLNKVRKVGHRCFSGNHRLELVVVPDELTYFDTMCFYECGDYLDKSLTLICPEVTGLLNIKYKFGNWNCDIVSFDEAINYGLDEQYEVDIRRFIE